jgi:hypothetical protein
MDRKGENLRSSPYKFVQVDASMKSDTHSEDYYLARCRQLIEEKLAWGSSSTWSHADFVEVSERISEEAGIALSVTTIKRILGKVKYKGSPAASTLNALAIYLGYENWRSFKLSQDDHVIDKHEEEKKSADTVSNQSSLSELNDSSKQVKFKKQLKSNKHFIPLISGAILLIAVFYFLSGREKGPEALSSEELVAGNILFNSEPIAKGLPNTVVFNYDISAFDFDSAFIQQNWDSRRRQAINREHKQMTSVYYYPGHYNAKLVLNDKVIKEHSLLIATEGWLGMGSRDESADIPVYLPLQKIQKEGALYASPEVLAAHKIDTRKDFYVGYSNARDFGVNGDHFMLEASVKNNMEEGGLTCQESFIFIDGEKGVIWFTLSALGCVGNASLRFGDVFVSGQNNDLSAFGTDLSVWNQIKCIVKNKEVEILLNDKRIYSLAYEEPIGKIMGLNFNFHGAGAVDYVRLKDEMGNLVYEDEF